MAQDPLAQDSMTTISTYIFYALNSCQKAQSSRDIYIFKETVSYFTQYLRTIREKYLVEMYKSLVIVFRAKNFWSLEFTRIIVLYAVINK